MKHFNADGYVCGKIDQRSTRKGNLVTSFSINSPDRRQVDGEWKSVAQFFQCTYWHHGDNDYRADFIRDKAHLVLSGDLRYEEWEGDFGKRSRVVLNVQDIFPVAQKNYQAKTEPRQTSMDDPASIYDEDIPF